MQRDDRSAGRACRRHLVKAGHLPELPLEWRRHRRRHHLGTGAGKKRLHLDCRIVYFREGGERQEFVGNAAAEHDRRHEKRGRDRAQYEDARWIHRRGLRQRAGSREIMAGSGTARHACLDAGLGGVFRQAPRRPPPRRHWTARRGRPAPLHHPANGRRRRRQPYRRVKVQS